MIVEVDERHLKKEIKKLERILQKLSGKQVQLAHASTLNKASAKIKTITNREASKSLKMKQADLRYISKEAKKERINLVRAKASKLSAKLNVSAKPVLLGKLNPRQLKSGVKVGQSKFTDSFIATPTMSPKGSTKGRGSLPAGLVGKQQVFTRKKDKRYPLKARYKWIKSTLQAVMNKHAGLMMEREVPRLLKREYDYRISKELAKIK